MSESTHTPGPWHLRRDDDSFFDDTFPVYDGHGGVVAAAWPYGGEEEPVPNPQAECNAMLIAAAPDLLDACRAVVAYYDAVDTDVPGGEVQSLCDAAFKSCRKAIAKATGVSPEPTPAVRG